MADGLQVAIMDHDTVRERIEGGKHWIVIFAGDVREIDEFDLALGKVPTYPTMMPIYQFPFPMTIVPKSEVPLAEIKRVMESLGAQLGREMTEDTDILVCGHNVSLALGAKIMYSLARVFDADVE